MNLDEIRQLAARIKSDVSTLNVELSRYQPPTVTPARHPRIPPFDRGTAVRTDPSVPLETVAARYGAGTRFLLAPGAYTINDVRCLAGMHFLGEQGRDKTILRGTGYGFRARDPKADGVAIGGVTLEGFCQGSTNALAAAVSPRWSDTLFRTSEQDWYGGQPKGWVLYDSHLRGLGSCPNGYSFGNNGAAINVTATGYTKTGFGLDRVSGGGLVDGCELWGNAVNPATGKFADGGDMKMVFDNAGKGIADVEPPAFVPPVAEFLITGTTFRGKTPDGKAGSPIGAWADLDCHLVRVARCEFHDFEWAGLIFELSSQVIVEDSLFRNCRGYGAAINQDFVMGALTFGESCHGVARRNRFEGCEIPIMVRQSNRTVDLARAPERKYDVTYAWRGVPFQDDVNRPWIDPEYRKPNTPTGMSNLATGELDFENNVIDSGRVVINAGTVKGGHDVQEAARVLASSIRFRGNQYGGGVRFDELDRTGMTLTQWRAQPGRQRDQ